MFELFGALLGGAFRIIPELFRLLSAKADRAHELAMLDRQIEYARLTGKQKIDEIRTANDGAYDTAALSALAEAIKAQGQLTGVGWIDAITQTVRPFTTYILLGLYIGAKAGAFIAGLDHGLDVSTVLTNLYDAEDRALLAGVINFWFLSRVLEKRK